jgi:O-succinylbenzoate synthase
MMIEQPLDYDDIGDHARLQAGLRTPVCLDESITSARLAMQALEMKACRVINIKPGRLGGFAESIRVHDACARHEVPVWHGGMLESGIGRAANLHLSTLPNFRLPGDIAASRRYFEPDLIDPPVDVLPDGRVPVPADGPGLGVRIVESRVEAATLRARELA